MEKRKQRKGEREWQGWEWCYCLDKVVSEVLIEWVTFAQTPKEHEGVSQMALCGWRVPDLRKWVKVAQLCLTLCNPNIEKNEVHGIWSHNFLASKWGKSGNCDRFYFLGLQNCCHEIKRHLLLGRKTVTNLESILKSRDITLPTKVRIVKAMVFPVVMNGCESGTIKKAESQRIDTFELWCWRRLLSGLQGDQTN